MTRARRSPRARLLPVSPAVLTVSLALAVTLASVTDLSPLVAGAAWAAEGKPIDKSRARYASGTAFFRLDKFAQALREFELGYLDRQDPAFLFNIAQCHRELHHTAEAVRFYRRFLSEAPEDHASRGQAEQALRELEGAAPPGPSAPTPEWQAAPAPIAARGAPEPQAVVVPLPSAAPAPAPASMTSPAAPAPAPPLAPPPATAVAASPAAPDSPSTPAYKKWWFWTLIGAGVVGGILIGVAATSGNTPLCPAGRTCL